MATVILQVPDESLVSKIKSACKMLVGVTSVKVHKTAREKEYDITKTAGYREAMDDVKNGRVYHADSVDDMFKQILGEEAFSNIRSSHV
jgi:collagenase-like PrtC family protease